MRFFSFLNKKKYGGLINDLKIDEFWEYLTDEEREQLREYSEPILSTYKTKVAHKDDESSFVVRSVTKIDDPDTKTTFHVRSATDFLTDLAGVAIDEKQYILAEKLLTEALVKNTNIFDLHYTYDKFIELYYTLSDNDINFREKCINACIKDIEIFNEIRKNTFNEYRTILKRSFKAGLIEKNKYEETIKNIGPKTELPIIDAFEILIILSRKTNNYDYAIKVCQQALNYQIYKDVREKYEKLLKIIIEEKEKYSIEIMKNKIEDNNEQIYLKERSINKQESVLDETNKIIESTDINNKSEEKILIDKLPLDSRIMGEYDSIVKNIKLNKYFEITEIDKLRKNLTKILTYWEREHHEDFEIKNIIFASTFLDYYENKDEKAIKTLDTYINICKKYEKEREYYYESIKLKYRIEEKLLKRDIIFSGIDMDSYKNYFRDANIESKEKNYDKAIELSYLAEKSASENNIDLTLNEEFKLPMYLTKIERYDEAEKIYEKILLYKAENLSENLEDIHKIYQKMKIMNGYKKNPKRLLITGINSYVWQAIYYYKKDIEKLDNFYNEENHRKTIISLLPKENKNQNIDNFVNYLKLIFNDEELNYGLIEKNIEKLSDELIEEIKNVIIV